MPVGRSPHPLVPCKLERNCSEAQKPAGSLAGFFRPTSGTHGFEIQMSNVQVPMNIQAPNPNPRAADRTIGAWGFDLLWELVIGAWSLEFVLWYPFTWEPAN